MKTIFKTGLAQFSMSPDKNVNIEKAKKYITEAAEKKCDIICLPELYNSLYFCQKEDIELFDLAEELTGNSITSLQIAARENNIAVVVPFFEKRNLGLYHNSLAVINNDGSLLGIYRKMHIPDDPAFYEKFYFAPGDLGYKNFKTKSAQVGTLICWDQWYPEAARITSLMGASILFYPTAIGWHPYEKEEHGKQQYESWLAVQRGHAVANGIYVAACNRTGLEKIVEGSAGIEFWGQSFICDPQGVIIAQAGINTEELITADIDLNRIEYIRRNWPFLRDRRIDSYNDINKRFIDNE